MEFSWNKATFDNLIASKVIYTWRWSNVWRQEKEGEEDSPFYSTGGVVGSVFGQKQTPRLRR